MRRASADPSRAGLDGLVASLGSADAVVVTEAAKALIERRAISAIDPLAKIDVTKGPESALSVIDALGKLGAMADGRDKDAAVDRLLALLAQEKRRGAPESGANLLQIYEALGDTRDPRAAAPLEAELLDADVGRAPKVVIVKALESIGLAESRGAFVTERDVQAAAPASTDAFEEELRKELVGALDKAIGA